MSYTIATAYNEYKSVQNSNYAECPGWEGTHEKATSLAATAKALLETATPEEIREYLDIARSILNDLEKRMNEVENTLDVATKQEEPVIREEVKTLIEEEKATIKKQNASRVKRSKQVDKIVETVKGKRDVNAGDKARIDATKEAAQSIKPAKVEQEKRTTKKEAPAAKAKTEKRNYNGMTYAQVRSEVSARKAKLNKADQERMSKAGLKNNTWEGAIASLEWLNKYFAK